MSPSDYCDYDGHEAKFFDSKGCALPGKRWLIQCPEYSGGTRMVIDARSVSSVILQAIDDIPPKKRDSVVQVIIRPHQAVGLVLENVLTAEHITQANDCEGSIKLGPVRIEEHVLIIRVVRKLDHDVSVVLADKDGSPVYRYSQLSDQKYA